MVAIHCENVKRWLTYYGQYLADLQESEIRVRLTVGGWMGKVVPILYK